MGKVVVMDHTADSAQDWNYEKNRHRFKGFQNTRQRGCDA